jgi:signal transduction histidine kinase
MKKLINDQDMVSLKLAWHYKVILLILCGSLIMNFQLLAQDKNLVQIKVFDQQLNSINNLSISINGKEFIPVNGKSTFYEISNEDLPPKFVKISKEELEAESWNYSKGTLEIIVRKKTYRLFKITITDHEAAPVSNTDIVFNGRKKIAATTNGMGVIEIPLAVDEPVVAERFSMPGYQVLKMISSDDRNILQVVSLAHLKKNADPVEKPAFLKDFSLDQIDSISSLTVFYAVFKNYEISKLDPGVRKRIDAKFNQLVNALESTSSKEFISKISDSSFVKSDVKSLLDQAKLENELLNNFREEFDEKVSLINNKLSGGAENLNVSERNLLLKDLNLLDDVLRQNEKKFYKNISDYRNILSSLKASFFDMENLENKLTVSEARRLEEEKAFRNRIIIAVSIAVVFGLMIIFLIALRFKLKKQQQNLMDANAEVKRINDNLEKLIYERTRLLIDAHKEMDIFLYRSSHDLRAPLCSIIGLCNLALQNSTADGLIDKISYTAYKMDKMLNKLRFISEINQPSNYSSIDLSSRLALIVCQFERIVNDNNVKVVVECDTDMRFYSYAHLVEIIIYNLVDNALFFSSVKGNNHPRVVISAKLENDNLVVNIYDNGVGVEQDISAKLWDMFFVGHESSRGNGLGLYIVAKSIQALSGKIDFESEPGNYTVFNVTIPVNTRHTASLTHSAPHLTLAEMI